MRDLLFDREHFLHRIDVKRLKLNVFTLGFPYSSENTFYTSDILIIVPYERCTFISINSIEISICSSILFLEVN